MDDKPENPYGEKMMDVKQLIGIMSVLEKLKCNTRHSWTSTGRHESVAEHTWRLALLAYFVKDEFPGADINKIILMCLVHDIGEAFTGDIPAFLKTEEHENEEENAVSSFLSSLPVLYRNELTELFEEMIALETQEARIYKTLDKMEALLQHNEADISTWLPLEYDLNLTYGTEETAFSKYMQKLRNALNGETLKKIHEESVGRDDLCQAIPHKEEISYP
jgi:putative hydrolase of HD superfamily